MTRVTPNSLLLVLSFKSHCSIDPPDHFSLPETTVFLNLCLRVKFRIDRKTDKNEENKERQAE